MWFSMNTREKGTEIGRKNETGDLLGGNFGSLDPTRREKKKKIPPKFVALKKETNEKIYIF